MKVTFLLVFVFFTLPVRASVPPFSEQLRCLNSILDDSVLRRGQHQYNSDAVLRGADGSIALYPVADSNNRVWHLFTSNSSYRVKFRYPKYNYNSWSNKRAKLQSKSDKIDEKVDAATKAESVDMDQVMSNLAEYQKTLDPSLSMAELEKLALKKIKEILASHPQTLKFVLKSKKVSDRLDQMNLNPPWGTVGAPLGDFDFNEDGVRAEIIPMVNRDFYGFAYDGPAWNDVELRPVSETFKGIPLEVKLERQSSSQKILDEEVLEQLRDFWSRMTYEPNYQMDFLKLARNNANARQRILFARSAFAGCSSLPGHPGVLAADYVQAIDQALK